MYTTVIFMGTDMKFPSHCYICTFWLLLTPCGDYFGGLMINVTLFLFSMKLLHVFPTSLQ